jgi:hypothetical protein
MEVGHELIVITWLHEARRDVLKGHPRSVEGSSFVETTPKVFASSRE